MKRTHNIRVNIGSAWAKFDCTDNQFHSLSILFSDFFFSVVVDLDIPLYCVDSAHIPSVSSKQLKIIATILMWFSFLFSIFFFWTVFLFSSFFVAADNSHMKALCINNMVPLKQPFLVLLSIFVALSLSFTSILKSTPNSY